MSDLVRIVRFHQVGGPDVLRIDELPLPQPGPGEARLRVKAIGLNHGEIMFRNDRFYLTPNLPSQNGYEASGVVEAVGAGVDANLLGKIRSTLPTFSLNDYGVYGEVAIVPASALAPYPESMTFEEGTSIWMQYITAYGALVHHAKVGRGDYVVLTAASGSVGPGAIQITKAEGAIAIATTRTLAKRDALLEAGADHVIVTAEEDVRARIMEITNGVGARVIFDCVGGAGILELAKAIANNGLILVYGLLSGEPTPFPVYESWQAAAALKSFKVMGYSIFEITNHPETLKRAVKYVNEKLDSGHLRPRIDRTFPLAGIADAHRYMESGQQLGKIVVTV
ncbi:zinc-dependent alcohol dehydrogenase family protein [Bradyrhizobium jicamae]|uniref:Zinc-dependent alcohol dehydrogenase family protein n=1 Tax=Bradyrhizobium jicamae TaxID=280332 RepID=A0ABS5FE16_9BRAD|nr:zinc-dependent alcohol dehydrogenase family protein [Bradyrhizobium jicamae]MBR0794919.1 zinc-dependent alcohol dehydrogenase family protein [Bradyrhizobium jicamae]